MTEPEWLAGDEPIRMLEFLRGSPATEDAVTWWNNRRQFDEAPAGPDRRFRLFACACCRRIWERIPMDYNRAAVVAVEEFLDGRITAAALEAALVASSSVEWLED